MAEARLEPPPLPKPNVVLTLTAEEAKVLQFITMRVGGTCSARIHVNHIRQALESVNGHMSGFEYETSDSDRAIYLKD